MEKIYHITGLDCPNCTAKLENALKQETDLTILSIDYLAEKLFLELADPAQEEELLHKLQEITDRVEPGVVISRDLPSEAHRKEEHHHDHDSSCCEDQDHAHEHSHSHTHEHDAGKWKLIQIAVSAVLFLVGFVLGEENLIGIVFFLISYLLIGWEILYDAVRNLFRGAVFDENFLMSVASIGAICIGNYPEGVAVMLLFQIGEYFQSYAVRRSRKSIAELMDIRPDHANVKIDGQIQTVSPETVEIGSTIVIKAGEKVPVDCVITEGKSVIDTSALTGESLPREVEKGELLLSGSINTSGLLEAETVKSFSDSTVSKILEMVENASSRKANTENFITKFSRYYTPIVVSIALLLAVIPPLVLPGQTFGDWIYRALTFLVVSCPCALVISVPLSFFAGVGGASKEGILIKGSNYLELLSNVDTVVFDKTGTITKGVFAVSEVHPTEGTEEELLTLAALGEASSNHPISQSILREYHKRFSAQPDLSKVTEVMELSGKGIKATIDGETVLLGNRLLLTEHDIPCPEITSIGTVVHVGKDGAYLGYLLISDEIKEDVPQAMLAFKEVGVRKTVMLTGDNEKTAKAVAEKIALDEVCAELLPNEKVEKLETILSQQDQEQKVAFVGDGINDAPVLARADIGIAMGGVGSDAAIEAADIVIMTDEISKLPVAIRHAKKTLSIVRQNILFALGVKLLILILSAFGIAVMWEAVFADVGVCLIAILNAMRALKVKK